jgi:uncharacterized DUF497 family protein
MSYYRWNNEKNEQLKRERGLSFEQVVMHVEQDDVLDVVDHPNQEKYPNQKILIVEIGDYAYLVPFVQDGEERFLKTIIPNRKATQQYLR